MLDITGSGESACKLSRGIKVMMDNKSLSFCIDMFANSIALKEFL